MKMRWEGVWWDWGLGVWWNCVGIGNVVGLGMLLGYVGIGSVVGLIGNVVGLCSIGSAVGLIGSVMDCVGIGSGGVDWEYGGVVWGFEVWWGCLGIGSVVGFGTVVAMMLMQKVKLTLLVNS